MLFIGLGCIVYETYVDQSSDDCVHCHVVTAQNILRKGILCLIVSLPRVIVMVTYRVTFIYIYISSYNIHH